MKASPAGSPMSLGFWIGALFLTFVLGLGIGLFFGKIDN